MLSVSLHRRRSTYVKSTMPVFAMAKDRPRMPLPMMALLKLKTDIPKEVWPGCCSGGEKKERERDCKKHFKSAFEITPVADD